MSTVPANYDDFEARDTQVRNIEMTTELVAAYVAHNAVTTSELLTLIKSVHTAIGSLGVEAVATPIAAEPQVPAVPIKKSVTSDYLISLEDGRKFKSLKRHLQSEYGMTPTEYRTKWGLPKDYPMVAPAYAAARSDLAKSLGLGRKSVAA